MLCKVCSRMLRQQKGRTWKGTYDLHFQHHSDKESLRRSAETFNCGICSVLHEELKHKTKNATSQGASATNGAAELTDRNPRVRDASSEADRYVGSRSSRSTGPRFNISAWLSVLDHPQKKDLYRLDFKLRDDRIRVRRTFILHKNNETEPRYRTRFSTATSSNEVYTLILDWIKRCAQDCQERGLHCGNVKPEPDWYPARLINLRQLRKADSLKNRTASMDVEISDATVCLIETKDWWSNGKPFESGGWPTENKRYVTLSHCWGQGVVKPEHTLTTENVEAMKRGVKLEKLPLTFREAITFAAQLPDVGYIWIDSLCIKQGDREDWIEQSAFMYKIYSETYLNISATDAKNSEAGLYRDRNPDLLSENEVVLNIEGLPGAHPPLLRKDSFNDDPQTKHRNLKRCTILDASYWSELIDNAHVNRRAWVLQERLMSPRVLHFCRDQVAWECCGFDAAEGQPEGMPIFQLTSGEITEGSRLKGLDVDVDGEHLRSVQLQGVDEPDTRIQHEVHALELWRRIVGVYSKTAITKDSDRLIALSGIAELMATKIGFTNQPAKYAAGLWDVPRLATKHSASQLLASQLLWQVEPVWREVDRTFDHKSKTPDHYRAPSWSWAAVNADEGHGVIYAEVTDTDLYIEIQRASVIAQEEQKNSDPQKDGNVYGLVQEQGTYLELWGKLRKAVLYQSDELKGRFGWRLLDRGDDVEKEQHTNVYLDCPADSSKNHMLGEEHEESRVYVIPAAKGPRIESEESKYLTCLMVQQDRYHPSQAVFKRIGVTKLSPWADDKSLKAILKKQPNDVDMPHLDYNHETGMSKIRLI